MARTRASCSSWSSSGWATRRTGERTPPRRSPRRWRSSRRPVTTRGSRRDGACSPGRTAPPATSAWQQRRRNGRSRRRVSPAMCASRAVPHRVRRCGRLRAHPDRRGDRALPGDARAGLRRSPRRGPAARLPREPARDERVARRGARAPWDAAGRCSRTSASTIEGAPSPSRRGASRCSPTTPWPRSASSAEPTILCPPSVRSSSSRRPAGLLGQMQYALGRVDEAEQLAHSRRRRSRRRTTSTRSRSGVACCRRSQRGEASSTSGETLVREALDILEPTDAVLLSTARCSISPRCSARRSKTRLGSARGGRVWPRRRGARSSAARGVPRGARQHGLRSRLSSRMSQLPLVPALTYDRQSSAVVMSIFQSR